MQGAQNIVPPHRVRPPLHRPRENLAIVLEGGDGHPVERHQKSHGHDDKQDVTHHGGDIAPGVLCPAYVSLPAMLMALRAVSMGHRSLPLLPS